MSSTDLDKNFFDSAVRAAHAADQYPQHYPGCSYFNRSIPINECACDCHERYWFELGREAERDSFYAADRSRA